MATATLCQQYRFPRSFFSRKSSSFSSSAFFLHYKAFCLFSVPLSYFSSPGTDFFMLPAFRRWALTILKPHEYAEECFQARCHGIRNELESEHSISLLLRKSICIFTPALIRLRTVSTKAPSRSYVTVRVETNFPYMLSHQIGISAQWTSCTW